MKIIFSLQDQAFSFVFKKKKADNDATLSVDQYHHLR